MDHGFSAFGETHAVVIVQGGNLIFERYGPSHSPTATCMSWSMAKSITHALVGLLVLDGLLDIHAPAQVPEWQGSGDRRKTITPDLLLRMSSGLKFDEVYLPDQSSDTIEMMWGSGKADVAHYAASQPLAHETGAFWSYSSGTTNILCRLVGDVVASQGQTMADFMQQRLFGPLGITSAIPKFDPAGTFIGSSFCFASARDFARFGLLYLRDGIWESDRLLPAGWVDYARSPTWRQEGVTDGPYGAHWWLDLAGQGSFSANGHEGQYTVLVPDLDLIVVRNGKSPTAQEVEVQAWIKALVARLR